MNFVKSHKLYRLFSLLSQRRKKHIYFLFILIILNGFVESLSISTIIPFLSLIFSEESKFEYTTISRYIPIDISSSDQLFNLITLLFCIFIIFTTFFRIFNNWYIIKLTAKIDIDLSNLIFQNNIYQPYINYTKKSSSQIISLVLEKVAAASAALNNLFKIILSLIISISIIISLLFFNWKIVLFSFLFLYIYYVLISKKVRFKLYKNGEILSFNNPLKIKIIQESFMGFRDIVVNNTEKEYLNLFNKYNSLIKDKDINNQFLIFIPKYLIEGLSLFIIAIIAYFSSKSNIEGSEVIATIGAFVYAFQRLLPLTQQTYAGWAGYKAKSAYINDILNELDNGEIYMENLNKFTKLKFNNTLTLKNVFYKYDKYNSILEDLNLVINKGDHIGIYGKTGSGKSTFLDILMGLLPPQKGKILVDKIDLYENNLQNNWISKISHVPQNIFLKEATIAENIAFGETVESINYELLEKASKIAQIYKFIKNSRGGFQTVVGERGIRLSGGQRQRIAIARALYSLKELLVLDEATSALDQNTEGLIIDEILKNFSNLTVVMVTHRMKSLQNCNRVFEVKNKSVFEEYNKNFNN